MFHIRVKNSKVRTVRTHPTSVFGSDRLGCVGEIASLPEQATGCMTLTPHESRPRDQNQRARGRAQAPRRPHRTRANSKTGGTLFDKPQAWPKSHSAGIDRTYELPSVWLDPGFGWSRTRLKFKLQHQSRTLAGEIGEIERRWSPNFAPSNLRFPRRADHRFWTDLPEKRWTEIDRVASEGI